MKCMTRLLEDHEDRQNNKVRCTKNEATAKKKNDAFLGSGRSGEL